MNIVHWNAPQNVVKTLESHACELVVHCELLQTGDYGHKLVHLIAAKDIAQWQADDSFKSEYLEQPVIIIGDHVDAQHLSHIVGILSTAVMNLAKQELEIIIRSYLKTASEYYLQQEVNEIVFEMDKMREQIYSELTLSKKIYQRVVPLRETEFSNCKIAAKFEAGLKGGGEYFDWIESKNEIFIYLFSTSSYAFTAQMSKSFNEFLLVGQFSEANMQQFYNSCLAQAEAFQTRKSSTYDFLFFRIDKQTLKLEGYLNGEHSLFKSGGEFLIPSENRLNAQLNRDDHVFIESAGYVRSFKDLIGKTRIEDLKVYLMRQAVNILIIDSKN